MSSSNSLWTTRRWKSRIMANYLVWTGNNLGEFIKADKLIVTDGVVLFLVYPDGRVVKTYSLLEFSRHNPDWKLLENTE
jgi:hypothetical protein